VTQKAASSTSVWAAGDIGDGQVAPRMQKLTTLRTHKILECNHLCGCSLACPGRCAQFGKGVPLEVFFVSPEKGYGVRCPVPLLKGTFVAEYTGELVSKNEREFREYQYTLENKPQYMIALGTGAQSSLWLDATYCGNVSRFFNHSCEPNLNKMTVFVEHRDERAPRVGFFAARDIPANEELCWKYIAAQSSGTHKCLCGSRNCMGNL